MMSAADLPRYTLAGHPEFSTLLAQVTRELRSLEAVFIADGIHHTFTLHSSNFEVARNRHVTSALGCMVCATRGCQVGV
ncbi:hypothetical protein [Deinococcus yunweiensis]|uniref:hypothetical protein n=1 Tax=Deinococcus yunweiensis TaxID=367282 RepID=UPI00398F161E